MTKAPQAKIRHFVPSSSGYILADKTRCQAPMRLSRHKSGSAHSPGLTYSHYFEAITDVISKEGYGPLMNALRKKTGKELCVSDIEEILVYAEKHGSDYHPARIEVKAGGTYASFVMNVAVTTRGRVRLDCEFDVLQRLNNKYGFSYLPRAYFRGETSHKLRPEEKTNIPISMFLADWFDGYHEFHLSLDEEGGTERLLLWDSESERHYLSRPQAWQVYSQAASILTHYYDLETLEQILPWHHAAGDFVVNVSAKPLDVRLVAARQYAPMLDPSEGVSAREALLLFLLNLSVRMRLDRLDGIGCIAWIEDECVDATLSGFMQALGIKESEGIIGTDFIGAFLQFLSSRPRKYLSDKLHALVDACDQAAPDIPVIREHLESHISKCHAALHGLEGRKAS